MSTRAKRRASVSSEVSGFQEKVRKSIVSLPSYVVSRVYEENYAELYKVAPSLLLSKDTSLDSDIIEEVEFFQDLSLLLVLLRRASALADAQLLTADLHNLFDDDVSDQMPRWKRLRSLAKDLGIDSLLPPPPQSAQSEPHPPSVLRLEAWIIWYQLRALRKILRELLAADGLINRTAPTTLPELIRLSDSSASRIRSRLLSLAADKSTYRKDNAMKIHGLHRQSTSSLPTSIDCSFHLDWTSHPSLSKAQKDADVESNGAFFRECRKLAMASPCGFSHPSSESYSLLTTFVNMAHHHWTESIVSALTEQAPCDPLEETLQASLPPRLTTLTLPSTPTILIDDSPLIPRRRGHEQDNLLRLMRRLSVQMEDASCVEESSFWALLGGNFEAATLLSSDPDEIALAALVAVGRCLAVPPSPPEGSETATGKGWRGSLAVDGGDEASTLAREGISERLRTFAHVQHRSGAIEQCCHNIFKTLRSAYAPMRSLAFDCLTLLANGEETETRESLTATVLSAVTQSVHPLTAMAAMEFILAWATAENDCKVVLKKDDHLTACPSLLISAYVERFCDLQEEADEELADLPYSFVLESCKLASSHDRETAFACLLVCQMKRDGRDMITGQRDVSQKNLSTGLQNLIGALASDFKDDVLPVFELAVERLLAQTLRLLQALSDTTTISHEEILIAHAQALVCIRCIAFAAPDCSAPLQDALEAQKMVRRLSETCPCPSFTEAGALDAEEIQFSSHQERLDCLTRLASLGVLMGLAGDVLECVYFDNLSAPERTADDYQTPRPIWGASARSKRDHDEEDDLSVSSNETTGQHTLVWESATCLREIRKAEGASPLQPLVTAQETLRKSFFRNVMVRLQETISICCRDAETVRVIREHGDMDLYTPSEMPECLRVPDFRDDDPTEKAFNNPTLIAFREFFESLRDVEVVWGISPKTELFCCSVLPLRQFRSVLARSSLRTVITRCGVHLCQWRPGAHETTSSLVRRVIDWVSSTVASSIDADYFPLGRHTLSETKFDACALSIRSDLGASSRIEIKKLLHRFTSILCVEKENAQALRDCQQLETLFARFVPSEEDVSD